LTVTSELLAHCQPIGLMVLEPLAEELVLLAAAREHGQEAAIMAVDVVHVLAGAELAVGHVEEVGPTDQGAQGVPGLAVGLAVLGVAVGDAAEDGNGLVGAHGQDPEQLLEVVAVVLVVAVRDLGRVGAGAGGRRLLLPLLVDAAEGDGGAVVVELVGRDIEAADGVEDELDLEGGAVGVEEAVEGATQTVVIEQVPLLGIEAEEIGVAFGDPVAELVEGATAFGDGAQEHAQGGGGRQGGARVGRQCTGQELIDTQSVEEGVEDGQGTQGPAMELEALVRLAGLPESMHTSGYDADPRSDKPLGSGAGNLAPPPDPTSGDRLVPPRHPAQRDQCLRHAHLPLPCPTPQTSRSLLAVDAQAPRQDRHRSPLRRAGLPPPRLAGQRPSPRRPDR
jgi:hypothetical protein